MNAPDNMDDIIDSRDVIKRIEELQGEREALAEEVEEALANLDPSRGEDPEDLDDIEDMDSDLQSARDALKEWDDESAEELKALLDLQDQCEGYYPDWRYGVALIRESYFEEYAQEYAEDIGAINPDATWPNNCIDWEQAARELRMDFSSVDFDGITYFVHS